MTGQTRLLWEAPAPLGPLSSGGRAGLSPFDAAFMLAGSLQARPLLRDLQCVLRSFPALLRAQVSRVLAGFLSAVRA
jgi:hypothetical protein